MTVEELGQVIGENLRDKDRIKPQLQETDRKFHYFELFRHKFIVKNVDLQVRVRAINKDAWIYGHNQTLYADTKWGNTGSGFGEWGFIVKRRYIWRDATSFNLGTTTGRLTTMAGDLRLA